MSVLVIYKVKGREIPHARKERETFTGVPSTPCWEYRSWPVLLWGEVDGAGG